MAYNMTYNMGIDGNPMGIRWESDGNPKGIDGNRWESPCHISGKLAYGGVCRCANGSFFLQVSFLSKLRVEQLLKIVAILQTQTYSAGDIIVRQGDAVGRINIIQAGQVAVKMRLSQKDVAAVEAAIGILPSERRRRTMTVSTATLSELQAFGELALLLNEPSMETVTATTEVVKVLVTSTYISVSYN